MIRLNIRSPLRLFRKRVIDEFNIQQAAQPTQIVQNLVKAYTPGLAAAVATRSRQGVTLTDGLTANDTETRAA